MIATKSKTQRLKTPDAYLQLVSRFSLKPIRNDAEHALAVGVLQDLLLRPLGSGAGDYLDTLILLVNKYEDEHHSPAGAGLSPREALRALMDANGLSQAQIGKIIGSATAVSMFLSGQRELSKSHIKALAARFHVDAGIFL